MESLPDLRQAPRFALVDQSGRARSSQELEGRVWIASFLFTSCPGSCPRIAHELNGVRERLHGRAVTFVTFSVDPVHDTPAVLAGFARSLGADADAWWFLTGPPDSLRRVVGEGFGLALADAAPGTPGAHGAILHSTRVALVDRAGHVRGYYSGDEAASLRILAHDAADLAGARR